MRVVLAALFAFMLALPAAAQGAPRTARRATACRCSATRKYPPGFTHFDYVNPDAPKGGSVRFGDIGTFDTLNPFILHGVAFVRYADSMVGSGAIFDSLMAGALDEPATAYGLIAESVEFPPDRSCDHLHVCIVRRASTTAAPITPEDVCWTFDTLDDQGPSALSPLSTPMCVKARCCPANRRQVHLQDGRRPRAADGSSASCRCCRRNGGRRAISSKTTLDSAARQRPLHDRSVDPGRSITYERVEDYWAQGSAGQRRAATISTRSASTTIAT